MVESAVADRLLDADPAVARQLRCGPGLPPAKWLTSSATRVPEWWDAAQP